MSLNGQTRFVVREDFMVALKTSSSIAKNLLHSRGKSAYQAAILPRLPASKQCATEPNGEFKRFTELPKEIQIMTWKTIIADSRLITQFLERASRHWLTGKSLFRSYDGIGSAKIVKICSIDCVSQLPRVPSYRLYRCDAQESILHCNAFHFIHKFGAKTIAMDLDQWANSKSEYDWPDRLADIFRSTILYTMEKVILFSSNISPHKLALTKTMINDFLMGSDGRLPELRDHAIRHLIEYDKEGPAHRTI
ncbi:hypothetical protein IFR05_010099 [Cadophora sp. M221]|nr:hypothetical protein IFR05_010099 [Cadophora sp. M221]